MSDVRCQMLNVNCQMLYYLILLYLLILPFGQLLRIPTPYPGLTIYPSDIIISIIILTWLFRTTLRVVPNLRNGLHKLSSFNSQLSIPYSPIHKSLVVFTIIALISLLKDAFTTPLTETLSASLYLIRWIAYASLFPILITLRPDGRRGAKLTWYLILTFTLITIFGLTQYIFYPDLRPLADQGWDPHYYRLTGSELDPGYTGILLLIGLIFIFQQINTSNKQQNKKLLITYYLLLITLYSAIALTYSRATYLATITSAIIYSYFTKSWKFLLTCLTIFLLTWLFLPRPEGAGGNLARTTTIEYRLNNYQQTLQIIKDHPILGVGFNRLRYVKRDYGYLNSDEWQTLHSGAGSDNSFLFVLSTTGIIGFTAYLWLWLEILKSTWPKRKNVPIHYYLLPITYIAIIVHSQFNNTLFYPPVMALIWILLGLSFQNNHSKV